MSLNDFLGVYLIASRIPPGLVVWMSCYLRAQQHGRARNGARARTKGAQSYSQRHAPKHTSQRADECMCCLRSRRSSRIIEYEYNPKIN